MKKINCSFFILTLLSIALTAPAQDNLVFNTPYYWLKEALKKTDLNDTAGALQSLVMPLNLDSLMSRLLAIVKRLTSCYPHSKKTLSNQASPKTGAKFKSLRPSG